MRAIRLWGFCALLALLAAGCSDPAGQERGGDIPRGLGKADGTNSCVDICGDQAPAGCWCDDKCEFYGDCCPDKQRACNGEVPSCEGHCGGKSPAGCYCDGVCEQYGDCCADKKDVCQADPSCKENADCAEGEFCAFSQGACISPAMNLLQGKCAFKPEACITLYDPVCGCDGKTYSNDCYAAAAGVSVAKKGACAPAPQKCGPFPGGSCPDGFTCNIDGCMLGAGGLCVPQTNVCTKEFKPVCGCDGTTYGNDCQRIAAGVAKDHDGSCGGGDNCAAQDAAGEGFCEMFMGYAWDGSSCVGVSGCSCVGADCGELELSKADCEAAHAGCVSCWGSWIDENGTCRTPADGVYPDSCCVDQKEQACLAIEAKYKAALAKARECFDGPTFAPQCTITKTSSLKCAMCPVPINTNLPEIGQAEDAWKATGCDQLLWACPAVMCIAPDGPSCVEGTCKFTYQPG